MSMILCGRDDVLDLMHPKYVQACEKQNPGLVERTIEAVSGEVGDALSYRYPQPWPYVPELVRYIATAISAYRVVGGITSLWIRKRAAKTSGYPFKNNGATALTFWKTSSPASRNCRWKRSTRIVKTPPSPW